MSKMPTSIKIFFALFCVFFGVPGIGLLILSVSIAHPVPLIFGLIMCACGWIPLYIALRKIWLKKKMLQEGEIIETHFVGINLAYYDLFGWRPYILKTQWHDPVTNLIYHFKSPALNEDVSPFMKEGVTIPVYIDRNNPKHRYYMDVSKIEKMAEKYFY